MESKVIKLLQCKEQLARFARSRQQAIANRSFIGAMFFQLEFYLARDQYQELKCTMTDKEFYEFFDAQFCIDHK